MTQVAVQNGRKTRGTYLEVQSELGTPKRQTQQNAVKRSAASNRRKAEREVVAAEDGMILSVRPHTATSEHDYDADEWEFCLAVQAYQWKSGRKYLAHTEYLAIAKGLGYKRELATVSREEFPPHLRAVA